VLPGTGTPPVTPGLAGERIKRYSIYGVKAQLGHAELAAGLPYELAYEVADTHPIALHPPSAHSVVPVTNEESSSQAR
jgi:hypothetical protein